MKKQKLLFPATGLCVIGLLTLVAWATDGQEEKITLDQVPAAVKATILKEAAGAKITEIERETKDGKTIYEAEFLRDGQEIEIQIAPDGTVLGREVENEEDDEDDLTIEQVPEPARAALLKLAGGAKIIKAERDKEHGAVIYEAEWTTGDTQCEAAVTADGTLVETAEIIPAEKAPAAVRAAIAKHFAAGAKLTVEKKMIVVYEVEAKADGKKTELIVLPTGQVHDEDDDHHDKDNDHDDGNDGEDDDD